MLRKKGRYRREVSKTGGGELGKAGRLLQPQCSAAVVSRTRGYSDALLLLFARAALTRKGCKVKRIEVTFELRTNLSHTWCKLNSKWRMRFPLIANL